MRYYEARYQSKAATEKIRIQVCEHHGLRRLFDEAEKIASVVATSIRSARCYRCATHFDIVVHATRLNDGAILPSTDRRAAEHINSIMQVLCKILWSDSDSLLSSSRENQIKSHWLVHSVRDNVSAVCHTD